MIKPATKQSVLLGIDVAGKSHVLAKGPEASYEKCRSILCDLTNTNGLARIDGGELMLTSAALLGNGRYHKRRAFSGNAAKIASEPKPKKAKAEK